MKPTLACGHTEYDRGHCGQPGCDNDYFACADCCPPSQLRGGKRRGPAGPWRGKNHQET